MKTRYWLAIVPFLILGAGAYVLSPPQVSSQAIETSVTRTPQLLDKAWSLPVAATYKHNVAWQSNGSLCGPASLANVFRSLGEPATTEAEVLDDTGLCWTGYCILGLTLDELAGVARKHSTRKVTVLRDLTAEEFRQHLRLANDPRRRYIINFSRKPIFGDGVGHHSPIGGYLEAEDLVFVLDVNHNFRPWFIERTRL
jgi:phytochelatin synthase